MLAVCPACPERPTDRRGALRPSGTSGPLGQGGDCAGARRPGPTSRTILLPWAVQAPPADETQSLTKGGVIDEEEMEIEMQSQPPAQRGTPGYTKAPR